LFLITCSIISCTEEDPQTEELILGKWTVESSMIDIYFDDQSLVNYFMDVYEISMVQAELLEHNLLEVYLDSFQGTITFKGDNTYEIDFGEEFDSGLWMLSADGKVLTFDKGTVDETVATIIKLSSSALVVEMVEYEEGDIDGDEKDDSIELHVTMTLKK